MATAQAGQRRRVIARLVLGREVAVSPREARQPGLSSRGAGANGDTIQKIAARDLAKHSKFAVAIFTHKRGLMVKWSVRFGLWRGGVMQKDHFPLPISFEENVGLLVVFVRNLAVLEFGADVDDVTSDRRVAARADLNMHVAQDDFFDSIPFPNIRRPFFLVRRKVGTAFGQVLREIGRIKRKILRKVIGFIGGIRTLLEFAHFLFCRSSTGPNSDEKQERN